MKKIIEVSDRLKIEKFMLETKVINPTTGQPFSANGLRLHFLGAVKGVNPVIHKAVKDFYENRIKTTIETLEKLEQHAGSK